MRNFSRITNCFVIFAESKTIMKKIKPIKTSTTIKEYKVKYKGFDLTIPADSKVSNKTACGPDDHYHFWVVDHEMIKRITGYRSSLLLHDLIHYGLNIPAEYCRPYGK